MFNNQIASIVHLFITLFLNERETIRASSCVLEKKLIEFKNY